MRWKDIDWSVVREHVIALAFPTYCCCCHTMLEPTELVCPDCAQELETLRVKKPRVRTLNGRRYRIHSIFLYSEDNAPSTIVKRVKVLKKPNGTRFMGAMIAQKAMRLGRDYDIVTYVPMSHFKEITTGFNHCEYLCSCVAKALNVEEKDCLKKIRHTKNQHDLSEVDRRRNLVGAFLAKDYVKGKRILLVDDVSTTGSTLCECAKALYDKGAVSVTLISFSSVKRNY